MIDLRRLAVLRAVAHYGTVTAAAETVHMTPSAASQQIRRLAAELGVELLEPHGRRVRLTPAARGLLRHADHIERYWQRAEGELHAAQSSAPSGVLRLAGFPTAACTLLAPLAARLQSDWPELTVEIREAEPPDCYDLLFSGDADLAVVESTPSNPPQGDARFAHEPLFDDPYDLLTHRDHPRAAHDTVALGGLAHERWIVSMPGTSARQLELAACSAAGFTPTIAHQARDFSLRANLVGHGLGIALVPRLVSIPENLPVARTPLEGAPRPTRRLLRVIRAGSETHPSIAEALQSLSNGGTHTWS
ncbi:LysR family transcriptional regulator [Streptomyces sp. NPDC048172]|uniref:LysR family transcriptional regulator n=1 Tax=Streptomyces sp. NPDC048172 TaxID=3365505 RepID=UPI003711862B